MKKSRDKTVAKKAVAKKTVAKKTVAKKTVARRPAGGRATEAGMTFQAGVGAWFSAHLLANQPIGQRFGLSQDARPVSIRFETGTDLDDVETRLSTGGIIAVQCKTRLALSYKVNSTFEKTVAQLVKFVITSRSTGNPLDPARDAAVLAIQPNASSSLDLLNESCRAFDHGGTWTEVRSGLSSERQKALDIFEKHARVTWHKATGECPTETELALLARLFRIVRFDPDATGGDRREGERVVGARLFEDESQGSPVMTTLVQLCRSLIRSGAPADRAGILQSLRNAGHEDRRAPGFDADIERLKRHSAEELSRLDPHHKLPIAGGIPLVRTCQSALQRAIAEGHLLIVGEPGAGKTGILVDIAQAKLLDGIPVVILSVDRHAGITTLRQLEDELRLVQSLLEVLRNWPGSKKGLLLIDALDASRGGPSEAVFANLLDKAARELGHRWSVVASIRTFDLKNGIRYRTLMTGQPPDPAYVEPGLERIRHFRIPQLVNAEFAQVSSRIESLRVLLDHAPPSLLSLLANVFNLSLAASMLDGGVEPQSIRGITTQSDLIDRYEDLRLARGPLKTAVKSAIAKMVERGRLIIRRIDVEHDALDDVLSTGVLVLQGERIQFAHHVLFDHASGRYYLDWDVPERLCKQLEAEQGIGLMLGPALRFTLERIWREDDTSHSKTWAFLSSLMGAASLNPVLLSTALRTVAERVQSAGDVARLRERIRSVGTQSGEFGALLSGISRFVKLRADEDKRISRDAAIAWATVAEEAAQSGQHAYLDGSRLLLLTLFAHADLSDGDVLVAFGSASRALLHRLLSLVPPVEFSTTSAIRFVGRSFASDPSASKELLNQILEEPRFSEHAPSEAMWLAEAVRHIAPVDAEFAVRIYRVLFERESPKSGKTWMSQSRILGLTSTAQQDYENARYHLKTNIGDFLESDPRNGTRAVNMIILGEGSTKSGNQPLKRWQFNVGGRVIEMVEDYKGMMAWREDEQGTGHHDDEVLSSLTDFLSACSSESFRASVEAAVAEPTTTSIWSRIFGAASQRTGVADDLLWPIATTPTVLMLIGAVRDIIDYLGCIYETRPESERRVFEEMLISHVPTESDRAHWWSNMTERLCSVIPREAIVTNDFRQRRDDLEQEGQLSGNDAFALVRISYGNGDDVGDHFLIQEGVDLTRQPDREINDKAKALALHIKARREKATVAELAALWVATQQLLHVIQTIEGEPRPESLHRAWGTIGEALERLVSSDALNGDGGGGMPPVDELFQLALTLSSSSFPEGDSDEAGNDFISWGSWDVRVYGAIGLILLAPHIEARRPKLLERLRALLDDPVRTVRLQVVRDLNILWDVDRALMWEFIAQVARREPDRSVLGFFVSSVLQRLASADPNHVEDALGAILVREHSIHLREGEARAHNSLDEHLGNLVTELAVLYDRKAAHDWLAGWIASMTTEESRLWHVVSSLRTPLFFGFGPNRTQRDQQLYARAKLLFESIIENAVSLLAKARTGLMSEHTAPKEREEHKASYIAANRLLDHAVNQLFFGSGAFRSDKASDESPGLPDASSKKSFLQEYGSTLRRLGQVGSPSALHHLMELLGYVMDAAPAMVFDDIAAIVTGPSAQEGYHHEDLAADELVKLVRRYLADHRVVFEDEGRRSRLVVVLELFSKAGWPDALKLLYDLPDLLR
jgi:hypothetical protein